jgi:hypothetical protein
MSRSIIGTDLQLGSDFDLEFVNGDLALVESLDAIRQHVRQRLQLFLGEWFLDITVGVPYFQNIYVKNPNLIVVEALFRDRLVTTPGIEEVNEFNFDYDNLTRELKVEFSATTINGDLNFSEILGE